MRDSARDIACDSDLMPLQHQAAVKLPLGTSQIDQQTVCQWAQTHATSIDDYNALACSASPTLSECGAGVTWEFEEMTPQQFITKWGPGGPSFDLNERQGAQLHFIDLCDVLGVPTPGSEGDYLFEKNTLVLGELRGYADVFKRNHFAWENKAPGKNLDAALKQLLTYSLALSNLPILVVCDRLTIRIHTQFNGHPSETHTVLLNQLDQPDKLALPLHRRCPNRRVSA